MNRFDHCLIAIAALAVVAAVPDEATAATASFPVGTACSLDVFPACEPAQDFIVTTDGALSAEVVASAGNCSAITVRFAVDGMQKAELEGVAPGGSTGIAEFGPVTPGTHTLTVQADVPLPLNCDLRIWSGTLTVTTSGVAASAVATVPPGGTATVSTVVAGSGLAGVRATLFRSQAATSDALFAVATYDGLPTGVPPTPIRAAAYLDLQLTNGDIGDVIAGEFLPPSPIFPTDPLLPPSPIFPTDPLLPPSPIRLAYWSGDAWSAVFDSSGNVPDYLSTENVFQITFDATSTPAVTALGGTVFATITGYYFRGFGIPLNLGLLNVAKAGRAIPLKWQIFDFNAAPVLDLDPAVVKLSSVAIPCEASGGSTDTVEEYATGASGLQNLGDATYQINWATLKSYAGSCRRLQLDLGERNPDGTVFYRTADFQFTR
jgi:hypothetical protein